MVEPPQKKIKQDGNLALVDPSILLAARDPAQWIEERRRNWPSKARINEKRAAESQRNTVKSQQVESGEEVRASTKAEEKHGENRIPVCRFFLRGKCFAGEKCHYRHERTIKPKQSPHERVYKRFEAPPANSLFVKLVQTDQQTEDTRFLQFLEFLQRHGRL